MGMSKLQVKQGCIGHVGGEGFRLGLFAQPLGDFSVVSGEFKVGFSDWDLLSVENLAGSFPVVDLTDFSSEFLVRQRGA